MNTKIEKVGQIGGALLCTVHGFIANENDRL